MQQLPPSTRPRGDITTVLDIPARDSQDGYFFPLDTQNSWFDKERSIYQYTTNSLQEFVPNGTINWGGTLQFKLDSAQAGDMLQLFTIQAKVGSWYSLRAQANLASGAWIIDENRYKPWMYINNLGISMIASSSLVAGDQTLETVTGDYMQVFLSTASNANSIFGYANDGSGRVATENMVEFHQLNPGAITFTPGGQYTSLMTFPFMKTGPSSAMPLSGPKNGSIYFNIKLRPFNEVVRSTAKFRTSPDETPLNSIAYFIDTATGASIAEPTASYPPAFEDFRIVTYAGMTTGPIRTDLLNKPQEQISQFTQTFHFSEPLNFLSGAINSTPSNLSSGIASSSIPSPGIGSAGPMTPAGDSGNYVQGGCSTSAINISIPLEINNPVKEIIWTFRRKGVTINNEWYNFSPVLETHTDGIAEPVPWLAYASIYINGLLLEEAPGDWWRYSLNKKHSGGYASYTNNIYGYSFARYPDKHQPSGYANMSKANSVVLNLSVNAPKPIVPPPAFPPETATGWELFVYVSHYNWVRVDNGLMQKVFST